MRPRQRSPKSIGLLVLLFAVAAGGRRIDELIADVGEDARTGLRATCRKDQGDRGQDCEEADGPPAPLM
jgi:hypothetical protein